MQIRGKLALVTGAGSGIGRATALALAKEGAQLVVCDIRQEGLLETKAQVMALGAAAPRLHTVDVGDRRQMVELAAQIQTDHGVLDILINNAGVGMAGPLVEMSLVDWDYVLSVNLMGVVHGCQLFVPPMVARGQGGHVVNVASILGLVSGRGLLPYCTSKFAVVGLSEGLRDELAEHRIGVSVICPGVIDTAIVKTARMVGGVSQKREAVMQMYQKRGYSPARVADAIVLAIKNNRGTVPVSPEAWLLAYVKRVVPGLAQKLLLLANPK